MSAFRSIPREGVNVVKRLELHEERMRDQVVPMLRHLAERVKVLEAEVRRLKGETEPADS